MKNEDRHLRELILGTIFSLSWYLDQYLLIKHQVDVVPGERQSFEGTGFEVLIKIPCPSVHSANTNRF